MTARASSDVEAHRQADEKGELLQPRTKAVDAVDEQLVEAIIPNTVDLDHADDEGRPTRVSLDGNGDENAIDDEALHVITDYAPAP